MRRIYLAIISVSLALCLVSCATSYDKRGKFHRVRGGESIWTIARSYRVDVQDLAEFNNIMKPSDVQPGKHIYIPEKEKKPGFKKLPIESAIYADEKSTGRVPSRKRAKASKGDKDSYSKPIKIYRGKFIWPLSGKVSSPFGIRNGRRHDGIDISARQGTPIKASASGKVVFSGTMRGYGNLILIRHDDNFFTAYAHNKVNKAKKGQSVKRGQVIAEVGRTGRTTGAHLHFEIRQGQKSRNPMFFLPERK